MADSTKPSAIIFGGLNTYSRGLAAYLVPPVGESKVSHLRIVDKFSVLPPTLYIGPEFPQVLARPEVEYKQANLTVESIVASCFDPPEGQKAFDYVFDFTGEIRYERPDMIQISMTANIARMIGAEAAQRNVKAYVRLQMPFYDTGKKLAIESDDVKPFDGPIGVWWHESLRILAAMESLNLVVLRIGLGYGPYVDYGHVLTFMTVASVYGHLGTPMKMTWGPGKHSTNTVHVEDIAGSLWACAEWMSGQGRLTANQVAGEVIPAHNDKEGRTVAGVPPADLKVVAPLFNLVDDSNHTLASLGQTLTSVFDAKFEFFNMLESGILKFVKDNVEEINEAHVGGWTEMIQQSNPPCNTHLSAYMDKYALQKWVVGFDNSKLKTIVGYTLTRPKLDKETIQEIVEKYKGEGTWPNL